MNGYFKEKGFDLIDGIPSEQSLMHWGGLPREVTRNDGVSSLVVLEQFASIER